MYYRMCNVYSTCLNNQIKFWHLVKLWGQELKFDNSIFWEVEGGSEVFLPTFELA